MLDNHLLFNEILNKIKKENINMIWKSLIKKENRWVF